MCILQDDRFQTDLPVLMQLVGQIVGQKGVEVFDVSDLAGDCYASAVFGADCTKSSKDINKDLN